MRIGIFEDNSALRSAMVEHFEIVGHKVVFNYDSLTGSAYKYVEEGPDFIFLDIHLKKDNGLTSIKDLKSQFINAEIIVITGDLLNQNYMLDAVKLGAAGFVYKPFSMKDLEATMEKIRLYGSYMEPENMAKLFSVISGNHEDDKKLSKRISDALSPKEREIVQLIVQGLSYKQMSDKLNISYHTVNHHLKSVYIKLDVKSKSELMVRYFTKNKV